MRKAAGFIPFCERGITADEDFQTGSFDPITRGHLDIIGKAMMAFDEVHVAIGTSVGKQRTFGVEESLRLIERSIAEHWPEAVTNASENWTPWMWASGGWSCRALRPRSPIGVAAEPSRRAHDNRDSGLPSRPLHPSGFKLAVIQRMPISLLTLRTPFTP